MGISFDVAAVAVGAGAALGCVLFVLLGLAVAVAPTEWRDGVEVGLGGEVRDGDDELVGVGGRQRLHRNLGVLEMLPVLWKCRICRGDGAREGW